MSDREYSLSVPPELVDVIARRVAELLVERLPRRPEPYLSAQEAAEYLAAPRSRIYELVERQMLRPYRDGRRLLFRVGDLDAVIDREEREEP